MLQSSKHLLNPFATYTPNIVLLFFRLNARLGGCNSIADSPVMHQLKKEPFMIMGQTLIIMISWTILNYHHSGADVGHPGPGQQKPSITSVTFSYDIDATRYVALTGIQEPRLEIIQDLQNYVRRAMMVYAGRNPPPKRLIFFRDGVSEGEYEQVAQQEIQAINGPHFSGCRVFIDVLIFFWSSCNWQIVGGDEGKCRETETHIYRRGQEVGFAPVSSLYKFWLISFWLI